MNDAGAVPLHEFADLASEVRSLRERTDRDRESNERKFEDHENSVRKLFDSMQTIEKDMAVLSRIGKFIATVVGVVLGGIGIAGVMAIIKTIGSGGK